MARRAIGCGCSQAVDLLLPGALQQGIQALWLPGHRLYMQAGLGDGG